VDLIYLDPPFNSKRDYNIPLGGKAQANVFQDTWVWSQTQDESLAFVGGTAAERAVDACRSMGFDGEMWGVNPRRRLRGLPTAASVSELPAAVDAAFVGVSHTPPSRW